MSIPSQQEPTSSTIADTDAMSTGGEKSAATEGLEAYTAELISQQQEPAGSTIADTDVMSAGGQKSATTEDEKAYPVLDILDAADQMRPAGRVTGEFAMKLAVNGSFVAKIPWRLILAFTAGLLGGRCLPPGI